MPELPEVETIARGLNAQLAAARILEVWLGPHTKLLQTPPARLKRVLGGARIANFHREGKHIVGELETAKGAVQWVIHLGMTGRCLVAKADDERAPHTHLIARMESGRELRFVDPRRFGKIEIFEPPRRFHIAGIEPLGCGVERFVELFRARRTPIKSALLNQSLLTGIGNIYADESLFRAGLRPQRLAARLTRVELRRLYESIQIVLAEAIAAGGSSVSDYVNASGSRGLFQLQHRVYRRTGEPCLDCGTKIVRIEIGGRSSHYCPHCQK